MKKRVLRTLACVTLLAVSLSFTACGSDDDKKDDKETTQEDTKKDDADESTSGNEVSLEEYMNSDEMKSALDSLKTSLSGSGMEIDIIGEGNVMTYRYSFTDVAKAEGMEEELSQELEKESSTFELTAESIGKEIGIDDLIVRVQYIDCNGETICERDFTAAE